MRFLSSRLWSGFFRGLVTGVIVFTWVGVWLLASWYLMTGYYTVPKVQSHTGSIDFSDIEQEMYSLYEIIQDQYYDQDDIDQDKMLRQALIAFVWALGDPFSSYLPPRETQEMYNTVHWDDSIEGIGAVLSQRAEGVMIIEITHSSPAERAGLQPLDMIIEVDGESTQHQTIYEVVDKIRWPKGTDVKISLTRRSDTGEIELIEKTITRDKIDIPSASWEILQGDPVIWYIQIASFAWDTTKRLKDIATDLLDTKIQWIILDLRGDGWWLLSESVSVSSFFLPKWRPITEAKYRIYKDDRYKAVGGDVLSSYPLVVLIDGYTASASEITALALRENRCSSSVDLSLQEQWSWSALSAECSVVLLGSKSFWKGSVQGLIDLGFWWSLKLTVGKWFSPSGLSVDQQWILPDYQIDFDRDAYNEHWFDNQLEEAKKLLWEYLGW